ncbi:MAG: exo-alpha-sialidase, partial [Planctomycetota bacterium]
LVLALAASGAAAEKAVFVAKGVPKLVVERGGAWRRGKGCLEGSGTKMALMAGKAIGGGDFRVRARLRILKLDRSAATFCSAGRNHFGFEGAHGKLFLTGPMFGARGKPIGDPAAFLADGRWFVFEVVRAGDQVRYLIDGKEAWKARFTGDRFGTLAFHPWRSTMQLSDFSAEGQLTNPPPQPSMPRGYAIPVVDLADETQRQVVVDREKGQYLGHPSTVLLEDGKTLYCVYPKGHGRGALVLKRSTDGGLTWSDRLPTPENWATSKEVPILYRVTDPQGVKRIILFSGLYPIRMAVSEDDGKTWTPLKPIGDFGGVVAMADCVRLRDGRYMALFHDDGRFLKGSGKRSGHWIVYKTLSADGGLTWGAPVPIAEHPAAHLCEPGCVRSPDGRQLCVLLRENSRTYNSFAIFSDDEGEHWSEPRELPGSLTGDRHQGCYAPDGRLFLSFRDTTHESPTKGDWVGWVGTYEDIVEGREGQYRVRLMDNHKGADCAYPAIELLPDGTFVVTTYGHWTPGEAPWIASVRFTLAELDARADRLPRHTDVFLSGQDGYHTYRIPSVITTSKGTLLAFCEGRKHTSRDQSPTDMVLKRSTDGGKTWGPMQVVVQALPDAAMDPCPVVDRTTGTIWLVYDRWPEGYQGSKIAGLGMNAVTVWETHSADDGATWSEPRNITATTKKPQWTGIAHGPGVGIQTRSGRLVVPCNHYSSGRRCVLIWSDDHGKTWQLGGETGPKMSESQVVELADGTLMLNMRSYRGKHRRAVATSTDGGKTWSEIADAPTLVEPVCQASFLRYTRADTHDRNRLLFANPAHEKSRVNGTVRLSYDEGKTWPVAKTLVPGPFAYSCLTVLKDMSLGCLYETDGYKRIRFARFTLDWLTDGEDRIEGKETGGHR